MRVVVSRSILDDALPQLRRVAEEKAFDGEARADLATMLRATAIALLAAPVKGLDADRDRLAAASPWGRTIDERRRKILSRRGAEFLLFVQVAMAPSDWFPLAESTEIAAKGPLIQFDDMLPPEACAEAVKQSEKVRSLRFFDALRRGPDPDADERELGAFRGISVTPIRDAGKDSADLTATLEKLDAVATSLER